MTLLAVVPNPPRPPGRRPRPLTPAGLGLPEQARTAGRRDSLTAHVRATVDTQVRVLMAEQATAGRADSPESVHQMRVAARRARVALRMDRDGIGPRAATLRDELAWLGNLLGEVRDLDVLIERLGEDGATLPEADVPAFGDVVAALLAVRSTAADALVAALGKQRYRALLRGLAAEAVVPVDSPAGTGTPIPADLLVKPVKALHTQLAESARAPSDEGWHILRIRVKRVRYAAELAARVAGRKRGGALAELVGEAKTLQEVLGAFQDTVAAEHRLRQLVVTSSDALSPAEWLVLGRLVERQAARRDQLREQLPAACGQLYQLTTKPSV
ncbi:MAG TPA: CHAD domain-containing protein [Pseudonocardiaceae bacterium]|nr:CHAD domain-containing protein [Pseudonocardiaceae bacterium]